MSRLYPPTLAFCLLALLVTIAPFSGAFAIETGLVPEAPAPGDPFVLTVTGVRDGVRVSVSFEGMELPVAPCGTGCLRAMGALDLSAASEEKELLVTVGETRIARRFKVHPVSFPEIHLKLPEGKVTLSEKDLARAKEEEKRLKDIFDGRSEVRWSGPFHKPLNNPVSTGFGVRRIMNKKHVSVHRGIDVRGGLGEPVRASNSGVVVLADELFYGGNTLVVDHGAGVFTVYMHLDRFAVRPGQSVSVNEIIAFVGSTGRSTGPHLHFGLKVLGVSANPLTLFEIPF